MKVTFKTRKSTVVLRKGTLFRRAISTDCVVLRVDIKWEPEELQAIKTLGLDQRILIEADNPNCNPFNRVEIPEELASDRYMRAVEHTLKPTYPCALSAFLNGALELNYWTLQNANEAVEQIKRNLATVKSIITSPEAETTFEI